MNLNISLSPEILFHIGSFPVTNSFLSTVLITFFIVAIVLFLRFRLESGRPGMLQNIAEFLLEGGFSFVDSILRNKKKTMRSFPLVMTLFVFILVANLAAFIPGQAALTLGQGGPAVFRSAMADYSMVFVLTMVTVITVQIVAIMVHGPFGYIGKFLNFKSPLGFFLGLMDIIGELAKVISLSFRLFGNIFAGEVLAGVMFFIAFRFLPDFLAFIPPLPFLFLGILTAVVQALVFSVLTLVFIMLASEIEEDELVEEASI